MAKKKAKKEPDENLEDDFGDLEEEELEILLPKLVKKTPKDKSDTEETISNASDVSEDEYEDEIEFELEEKPEIPDYKYLNLKINKVVAENDYEIEVIGQSHGFCNIFVKHLLNIEGVNIAAYKITGLEPPKIYIRLEDKHKIKDILYKGIESLREEVVEVEKLFQKLM
ncbi:MAG: RpoL/Rpb11 RNA polymerase subunit family protein [Candidatus Thorarchaeota archaeon]